MQQWSRVYEYITNDMEYIHLRRIVRKNSTTTLTMDPARH
jgi:hypothetical protein